MYPSVPSFVWRTPDLSFPISGVANPKSVTFKT
jgi:hypothetical protein